MGVEYVVVMCRDGHCNVYPPDLAHLDVGTASPDDALVQLEAVGWAYHSAEYREGLDVMIMRRET